MGEVGLLLWIPLPLFAMAAVLSIVGLATPGWIVTDNFDEGIYQRCAGGSCEEIDPSGIVMAVRILLIDVVILIAYVATLQILYILMVSKNKVDRYAKCCSYSFPQFVLSSSLCGFVLIAIADVLMAVEAFDKNDYPGTRLGYSFYLTVVAALAMLVAGGASFHGRIQRSKVKPTTQDEEDNEPTKVVIQ